MLTPTSETAGRPADPPRGPGRARAFLPVLLRALVGIIVIALLVWRTDLSSVVEAIGDASLGFVTLALVLLLAALVLGAFRWHPYLRALGFELPVVSSIRLTLIGTFFNAFLPTGIGGDTYRALRVPRPPGTLSDAVASVILDRAAGVVGMAALALIGLAGAIEDGTSGSVSLLALVTGVVVIVVYGVLLVVGGWTAGPPEVGTGGIKGRGIRFLASVARGAGDLRASGQALAVGIGTALLFLVANASLAQALDLSVPIAGLASLLLLASVVSALPLSINGVGLREAVYVWGLGAYGVGRDAALAFALLVLATALATSAVGGVVYVAAGGRRSVDRRREVGS